MELLLTHLALEDWVVRRTSSVAEEGTSFCPSSLGTEARPLMPTGLSSHKSPGDLWTLWEKEQSFLRRPERGAQSLRGHHQQRGDRTMRWDLSLVPHKMCWSQSRAAQAVIRRALCRPLAWPPGMTQDQVCHSFLAIALRVSSHVPALGPLWNHHPLHLYSFLDPSGRTEVLVVFSLDHPSTPGALSVGSGHSRLSRVYFLDAGPSSRAWPYLGEELTHSWLEALGQALGNPILVHPCPHSSPVLSVCS
jgi:hypothetical protein